MWKALKADVNNCSKEHCLDTVMALKIRLLNEQFPSKTFIVSKKENKKISKKNNNNRNKFKKKGEKVRKMRKLIKNM